MSGETHLHLMRLILQARTPLSPASGERDGPHDMALTRDASGLPQIRGSSLQGILRALRDDVYGDADALFGCGGSDAQSRAGQVIFSDGVAHDGKNNARLCPITQAEIAGDDILRLLARDDPICRDHVKLGHRHAAEAGERAKFDRIAVPIGTRFSVELSLWGLEGEGEKLKELAGLFTHPALRIGGAGGRGYGAVDLIKASLWTAPLSGIDPQQLRELREGPISTHDRPFVAFVPTAPTAHAIEKRTLKLEPIGFWRIGQTGPSATLDKAPYAPAGASPAKRDKAPDAVPVREPRIEWNGGRGVVRADHAGLCYVVPGAGIRGVLAHRTLFHFNRMKGKYANPDDSPERRTQNMKDLSERPKELAAIFGAERRDRGGKRGDGEAGRLLVNDTLVEARDVIALDHNSIDRFTGGVRNRLLFSEEVVFGGEINITFTLLPPRGGGAYDSTARKALYCAIADLCEGRLAIGAKSLGFCVGDPSEWRFLLDETREAA